MTDSSKIPVLFVVLFAGFVGSYAQSGRVKVTPTPTPPPRNLGAPVMTSPPPVRGPAKPTPTPKDGDEIIKVESALVPIPAAVLDERGRPIATLKITDFELMIDGKPAEIGDLTRSEAPVRLAMLFDNSASVMIARDFEREAAMRFFRRVIRPNIDLAALFSVADYTRREQPLTNNVRMLTQAIELFPPPGGATALLDGVAQVAEYLRSVEGRRVVVIVSDGEDTYSDTTLEYVIRQLSIANCQVYVVKTTDFENYKRTGQRGSNANTRQLIAERRMIDIAQATGGAVYSPITESEMDDAFKKISAELSQQYVLSYYPEDDADKKGQFRDITLTVKGRPNVSVRTRKGYYVPKR